MKSLIFSFSVPYVPCRLVVTYRLDQVQVWYFIFSTDTICCCLVAKSCPTLCDPMEPRKIKSITVTNFSPSICYEVMGPEAMILNVWMLSFKPGLLLSSFTLIKKLFSFSSLYAIRVVSSPYLRFLMFLPVILWFQLVDSSSLTFCIVYSVNRIKIYTALLYSFPNFEPVSCSMSSSNCCFLTCI